MKNRKEILRELRKMLERAEMGTLAFVLAYLRETERRKREESR